MAERLTICLAGLAISLLPISLLTKTLLAVSLLTISGLTRLACLAGLACLTIALLARLSVTLLTSLAVGRLPIALLAVAALRVETGRAIPLIARVLVSLRVTGTGGPEDLRVLIILATVLRGLCIRAFWLGLPQVFGRIVGVLPVRAVTAAIEGIIVLWCHFLKLSVPGAELSPFTCLLHFED